MGIQLRIGFFRAALGGLYLEVLSHQTRLSCRTQQGRSFFLAAGYCVFPVRLRRRKLIYLSAAPAGGQLPWESRSIARRNREGWISFFLPPRQPHIRTGEGSRLRRTNRHTNGIPSCSHSPLV